MITLVKEIPGLSYISQYITWEEHFSLLKSIDLQSWSTALNRRVQQYGYAYYYKKRAVNKVVTLLDPLPLWANFFLQKLQDDKLVMECLDQMILNEYQPGQGISEHIDCVNCFGAKIFSLSLGSSCVINFRNVRTREEVELLLEPCSLLVISDEARYNWKHSISSRKSDYYQGHIIQRERRVSVTFRKVIF